MTRSVGEELTRASDLLDGTKTDVISFFDEVGSLMIVVIRMILLLKTMTVVIRMMMTVVINVR